MVAGTPSVKQVTEQNHDEKEQGFKLKLISAVVLAKDQTIGYKEMAYGNQVNKHSWVHVFQVFEQKGPQMPGHLYK